MVHTECKDQPDAALALASSGIGLAVPLHPGRRATAPSLVYAHGPGRTRRACPATATTRAAQGPTGLACGAHAHGGPGRNPVAQPYTARRVTDDLIMLAGDLPADAATASARTVADSIQLAPHARYVQLANATHMLGRRRQRTLHRHHA